MTSGRGEMERLKEEGLNKESQNEAERFMFIRSQQQRLVFRYSS